MVNYTIKVFTPNNVSNSVKWLGVRLVGTRGQSEFLWVRGNWTFFGGDLYVSTVTLKSERPLGEIKCVDLKKNQLFFTLESEWFVDKVEVTSSLGKLFIFPVYLYIRKTTEYSFCEGTALLPSQQRIRLNFRNTELERRAQIYSWDVYMKGWPKVIKLDPSGDLPEEVKFSSRKIKHFGLIAAKSILKVGVEKVSNFFTWDQRWHSFDAIKEAVASSPISDYVREHWGEDAFFGYQCLNGVNPTTIRKCNSLPANFVVTDDMVTLEGKLKLSEEMQNGNIFICDYKILDGVKTSLMDNSPVYLMAPLVLLHLTPNKELKPVAIELKQDPAEDNPVFLHSDSELDWLYAKTFARGADYTRHQLDTHLLRTHLLAEVFAVSMLRNFAKVHPLHKLLVHSTRYTLNINMLARKLLINEGGIFSMFSTPNVEGVNTVITRGLKAVTYDSLCIKEDVRERGMEAVPSYFYRDDGFKLWDIIYRFAGGVIKYYYKSDEEVVGDSELQNYIKDIFEEGFLSNAESGIPQSFEKVDELIKFVTMVLFTCSAQHAAVNNGQFDFGSWIPNTPAVLMEPPPITKGTVTESGLLRALPSKKTTANGVAALTLLSTPSADFVALGQFPDEHFTEATPRRLIDVFRAELKELDDEIDRRNEQLDLPYTYLKPCQMENSVSI